VDVNIPQPHMGSSRKDKDCGLGSHSPDCRA
jgi:hypothetical protein